MSASDRASSSPGDATTQSAPSASVRAPLHARASGKDVLGQSFGRYEALLRLAAGGMGQVLVARVQSERGVRRLVALKTILAHLTDNELFLKMFVREAEIASRLHHPNVIPVLELGRTEDEHFLVMEYFPSVPLNAVLRESLKRQKPMPPDVAAAIVADAAGGLHAAHELTDDDGNLLHLVHRDATPSNLLIGADGSVKVTDFGVAKATGANFENMTVSGDLRGKIGYLSPEQVTGEMIDRRSDVFTLGIVLWECLAGRRLFGRKDSEVAAIRALMDEPIPDVRELAPHCTDTLARIVARALERDRNRRYQSAAELRQALTTQLLPDTDKSRSAFAKATIGEILADRQRAIAAAVAELDSPTSAARRFNVPVEVHTSVSSPSRASLESNVAGTARTVPPPPQSTKKPVAIMALVGALGVAAAAAIAVRMGQRTPAHDARTTIQAATENAANRAPIGPTVTADAASAPVAAAIEQDAAATAIEQDAGGAASTDEDAAAQSVSASADAGSARRGRSRNSTPERTGPTNNGTSGGSGSNNSNATPPERIEM
ncbi:MAG: serine/threonine-protein kinase [Polyangiales bacterium]